MTNRPLRSVTLTLSQVHNISHGASIDTFRALLSVYIVYLKPTLTVVLVILPYISKCAQGYNLSRQQVMCMYMYMATLLLEH